MILHFSETAQQENVRLQLALKCFLCITHSAMREKVEKTATQHAASK